MLRKILGFFIVRSESLSAISIVFILFSWMEVSFTNYLKIMRDLREDADLTQQNVADVLGTSQTMYARYERGANELPIHHMLKLCELYDVSADYFLGIDREDKGSSD